MYIYFCEKCQKFEAFKSKTGNFKCPDCGKEFLPLGVSVEEWNEYSNEEMLNVIEQAKKPVIKTPVFNIKQEEATTIEADTDFEPVEQITPRKRQIMQQQQAERYDKDQTVRIHSSRESKSSRSIPWMFVGIASLIIGLGAWVIPGTVPTFICIGVALLSAILSLCFKGKLKAFPIIALIITGILLVEWGIEGYHYLTDPKEAQDVTYGRLTFTIPADYLAIVEKGDTDFYRQRNGRAMIAVMAENNSVPAYAFSSSEVNIEQMVSGLCKEWLEKDFFSVNIGFTQKKYVAGLPGVEVFLTAKSKDGDDISCEMIVLSDDTANKGYTIANVYGNKWEGKYKGNLQIMMNSAKVASASGYVNSTNSTTTYSTDTYSDVTESETTKSVSPGGVDPELKAALDEYEAFMDEYVSFMKKYQSDPGNAISMLADYTSMLSEYAQYVEKIDAYDKKKDEMSAEDLKYFLDVTNRVEKKMIDVIQ